MWPGILLAACANLITTAAAGAEQLDWSRRLNAEETGCLFELMRASDWPDASASLLEKLIAEAVVSRTDLNHGRREDYVYIIHDFGWCGSAGCKLLIGERRNDGVCHLLYDGHGDDEITILRRNDNGYRRLYTQCEIRFDGRQYQQIHPDCPTLDVQH